MNPRLQLLARIALLLTCSAAVELTFQSSAHLKAWFAKHPAGDANHDGALTSGEAATTKAKSPTALQFAS